MSKIQPIRARCLAGAIRLSLMSAIALPQLTPPPAHAQVEILAPAICSTGVGCVLLGTVVIGGIGYYLWKNNQTGEEYRMPIADPEEEVAEWDEPIIAQTPEEADRECRAKAAQYGVELVRVQQPNRVRRGQDQRYRCWFK
jgi:hypothetical protein